MAWGVKVLKEEEEVLTVCKPASVPVSKIGSMNFIVSLAIQVV